MYERRKLDPEGSLCNSIIHSSYFLKILYLNFELIFLDLAAKDDVWEILNPSYKAQPNLSPSHSQRKIKIPESTHSQRSGKNKLNQLRKKGLKMQVHSTEPGNDFTLPEIDTADMDLEVNKIASGKPHKPKRTPHSTSSASAQDYFPVIGKKETNSHVHHLDLGNRVRELEISLLDVKTMTERRFKQMMEQIPSQLQRQLSSIQNRDNQLWKQNQNKIAGQHVFNMSGFYFIRILFLLLRKICRIVLMN